MGRRGSTVVLGVIVALILALVGFAVYVEITGDDAPAGPHTTTCRPWRTTTVCN